MGWTRQEIQGFTTDIPPRPGVYVMRDRRGRVVYVGKAVNLHSRVSQYFRESGDPRPFVKLLKGVLGRIETIVTANEREALILENELIKKHKPPFNVLLKDDKAYLYLKVATDTDFPRVELSRRRTDDGAQYFGPSHSAASIRETLSLVNRNFGLRTCRDQQFRSRRRPCLEWQMKRCAGPCCNMVTREQYRERVDAALVFLKGHYQEFTKRLTASMKAAAEAENFEEAARLRDQMRAVDAALARQAVVLPGTADVDAIGFARDGDVAVFQVLRFESGVLKDCLGLVLENVVAPEDDLVESVLAQHYSRSPVPASILVPDGMAPASGEQSALTELLSTRSGKQVRIRTPRRGPEADALRLAIENAVETLKKALQGAGSRTRALESIRAMLGLDTPLHRIEGFDMSQFQGSEPVGSMVVMTAGRLDRHAYRTYSVKWVESRGDTGFMREVLTRRLSRLDEEQPGPDLIMLDGGASQVATACAILNELGLEIPVVGIAKSRVLDRLPGQATHSPERLFVPESNRLPIAAGTDPATDGNGFFGEAPHDETHGIRMIVPDQNDPGLHLLMRLRDEAHRFAIQYHRKLRDKKGLGSALDGIDGLGKARRTALLRHFRTVAAIRAANLEELNAVPGLPANVAQRVFERMHEEF